jgi:hypothetical protein
MSDVVERLKAGLEGVIDPPCNCSVCIDRRDAITEITRLREEIIGYAEALASSKEHNHKINKRYKRAKEDRARLRKALKPFAETKANRETAEELVALIIETTGDGVWADWIYDLLMKHCPRAAEALKER